MCYNISSEEKNMNKKQSKEFIKRYDKFKKNNLPTPFWDDERQVREFVYFYNGKSFLNFEEANDSLEVSNNLVDALADIAYTGFYYSFTDKHITGFYESGEFITKAVVGHSHAHSFEGVVECLYRSPESFSISKDEEKFYSTQELEYLRRVQKYLLFIGMKDLESTRVPISRYRNKVHSKYEDVLIHVMNSENIKNIESGKVNFKAVKWYPEHSENCTYKPKEYRALIVDEEDNFKFFVEYEREDVKLYKDIKDVYKIKNFKDDSKVILIYFKILEQF